MLTELIELTTEEINMKTEEDFAADEILWLEDILSHIEDQYCGPVTDAELALVGGA